MWNLPWCVYRCYGRLDENFGVKSVKLSGVKSEYEEILLEIMKNGNAKWCTKSAMEKWQNAE